MIRFSKGRNDKTLSSQLRIAGNTLVFLSIKNNMFINLITQEDNIFSPEEFSEFCHISGMESCPRRIMRRVDNQHFCFSGNQFLNIIPRNRKILLVQPNEFRNASG